MEIEILEHIDVPDQYLSDGKLFLDTTGGRLQTKLNNVGINASGQNKNNATLSFDVPYNPVNRLILSHLVDAHGRGLSNKAIPVLSTDGAAILEFDSLRCISKVDSSNKYKVQLSNRSSHPLTLADQRPLNTIFHGNFQLTKANIEAQFPDYQYADGDPGYRFAFKYFGGTYKDSSVTAEDMRPCYSPLSLFQKGFDMDGWKFSSPILETDVWRSVWAYLSDETYGGATADNLDRFRFLLRRTGPLRLGDIEGPAGFIDGWTVEVDNDDLYNQVFIVQPLGLSHQITLEYKLDATNVARDTEIQIVVALDKTIIAQSVITLVDDQNIFEESIEGVFEKYIDATIYPAIVVRINTPGKDLIINELKIYNKPIGLRYIENQYIDMSQPLSSDISLGDLIKGVQRMICGLPVIDWGRQEIVLHVPYDVDVWGQLVLGHLKRGTTESLDQIIIKSSQKAALKSTRQSRYNRYGFAKSSDNHIKSLNLKKDVELFDKLVDLGTDYEERTTSHRNPLFQPTDFTQVPTLGETRPPFLPMLTDNDDGEISKDIGPRIFIATPSTQQRYKDDEGTVLGLTSIKWYDTYISTFPTYYQSLMDKTVEIVGVDDSINLVYGSNTNDFWEKYLKIKTLSNLLSQVVSFDVCMSLGAFTLFDLSTFKSIQYGYEFITGFVQSLNYNHEKETGVLEIQVPIDTTADLDGVSESGEDDLNCGSRKAQFKKGASTVNDEFAFVSHGGLADTTTWDYREINIDGTWPTVWVAFPTSSLLAASRPALKTRNQVRLRVRWKEEDGIRCPDNTGIKEFDPCQNAISIDLQQVFDVPNKNGGLRVNLNFSNITGTIDTIVSTVSLDQAAPVAYNIDTTTLYGDFLYPTTGIIPNFILETLVITFVDGCEYTLAAPIPNHVIDDVDSVGTGSVVSGKVGFNRVGRGRSGGYVPNDGDVVLSKTPVSRDFLYKNDNVLEPGLVWSGEGTGDPKGNNPWFRARYTFSDGSIVHSDWHECIGAKYPV